MSPFWITRKAAVARIADRTGRQWLSRSFKVSGFHVIRKPICDFILVINNNLALVSHRFRDTATYSLKLKIGSKPLQIETLLLLTAYRKLPAPYPMAPSPTLYGLPFGHNNARLLYQRIAGFDDNTLYKFTFDITIVRYDHSRSSKVNYLHVIWKQICDFLLVINSNLDPISHRLATIHPWRTDRQTNGQTTTMPNSSTVT